MIIELTNTSATITDHTPEELAWLRNFLTFKAKDFVRVTVDGEQVRHEGQVVRLLNTELLSYPAGLTGRIVDAAPKAGVLVRVDDRRTCPKPDLLEDARARIAQIVQDPSSGSTIIHPPPYKHQAVAAERALRRTRGLIEIPTGGGKGNLIPLLVMLYPVRWVALVPSQELLEQTAMRFESLTGLECGRIGDGQWITRDPLTVATFQTLDARLHSNDPTAVAWVESIEAVAADEAHTLTGNTFHWVLQRMRHAYLRLGLSATPFRGTFDDIYPIGATGDLIYKVLPAELHALGLVAYPRVRAIQVLQGARVKRWQTAHDKLVINGAARNMAIAVRSQLAIAEGHTPGLVLVDRTQHGLQIQAAFAQLGMSVPLVHGKVRKKEQKRVLAGLVDGSEPLAIATSVWRTGVDIPRLRFTFHAGGGKATIPLFQGLGRGMRVVRNAQGKIIKDTFLALDVADEGCSWLANHWRQRRNEYKAAGYEVVIES